MILVDPRAGSADLHPQLIARGLPSELSRLEYGDVSFIGNGPSGMVSVGIEYKRTSDAIACMTNGRFAGHQLPGLMQTYQQYWLLIEGMVRCGQGNGSEGVLQVFCWPDRWRDYQQGSRYIMWREYQHWLMSLQQMAGVKVAYTSSLKESAAWVGALYSWWSKEWREHKSVQTIYTGIMPNEAEGGAFSRVIQSSTSLSRLWALSLPGIGHEKSKQIELAFPTGYELANADEDRWMLLDGIGKTLSKKIVSAIRSRADGK